MEKKAENVDEYIAKAADFAQPILKHIRALVHQVHPESKESIKWGFPNFEHKGIFLSMAAFKQHCSLTFFKGSIMEDEHEIFSQEKAMGHLGRINSLEDLPADDILKKYIKEAVALNEKGVKVPKAESALAQNKPAIPYFFKEALGANEKAQQHFQSFSQSKKKEYIDWLEGAKTEATRNKRLETAIQWISEGKDKNWKYKK